MKSYEAADRALLPAFERHSVATTAGNVRALVGGSGAPLLLLHGDPQTHLCWHRIAPSLARHYTVVLTDLRGRGESHKPAATADHLPYSKREMAAEQVEVMRHFGFERFAVVGHDRGARVARRLALDHPDRVERLAVMDIVPALDFYERADSAIAQDYFYFFFLTQPSPKPEALIAGNPRQFMRDILTGLSIQGDFYDSAALELYLQASSAPDAIAAMCECFRAGITRDIEHDREDLASGRRIACPTLVLWGEHGVVGRHFDMAKIWRRWAPDLKLSPMPSGHFIPEEAPAPTLSELRDFLGAETS